MKLHCPHCGVNGSADDSYRGKNVKCPKCLKIFIAAELERQVEGGDAPAPSISIGEQPAAEMPADIREDEAIVDENEVLVRKETPVDQLPAGETVRGPEVTEAVEEGGADTTADREEVVDWSDMVSEIDAREADDESREKMERERTSADLDKLFTDGVEQDLDRALNEKLEVTASETELAGVAAGVAGEKEYVPGIDEQADMFSPAMSDQEKPTVEPAKSEKSREDYFIFEDDTSELGTVQEVESQPYGLEKEQCWQCGKKDRVGVPFITRDGRLYCPDCVPAEELEAAREEQVSAEMKGTPLPAADAASPGEAAGKASFQFTIGGVIREAWEKTKGAKGAIWAGSAVMYLAVLILVAGTSFLLPMNGGYSADAGMVGAVGNLLLPVVIDGVSVLFTAGLLFMGVRKVAGDSISWKMVFTGFSVAGKIIVAAVLQSILVVVGLLLLVLPGIYLAIGYAMTMPLIIDRNMSPWQAMEASRKAIHKIWWKVAGLFLATGLLFLIAAVPFGIGLIWMWPMSFVLAGVVYRHLFGVEKKIGSTLHILSESLLSVHKGKG